MKVVRKTKTAKTQEYENEKDKYCDDVCEYTSL